MRALAFTRRCFKELLRDPLTLIFGIAFPVVLLLMLSIMNRNIPAEAVDLFQIEKLLPGIVVFGFSFLSLFGGLLLAGDRDTAFLTRLFTSPLRAHEFLIGYAIPLMPVGLAQALISTLIAFAFGLEATPRILLMLLFLLPCMLFFILLGLLLGSLLSSKQVGSISGALLTNLSAWLSGTWFSLDLMGKGFKHVAFCLPFANAVEAARIALSGALNEIWKPFLILCAWTIGVAAIAIPVFHRKMRA